MNLGVADMISQGVDAAATSIISDRLRTELFKQGGITVLERNAMQEILKEQGFQQSGCTSDACAVQIGELLGVTYMVVGTVGKLGKLFTIDVRMIQVATGKIVYSVNVDCECPIEKVLTGSIVEIAQKISQYANNPGSDDRGVVKSVHDTLAAGGERPRRVHKKRPALKISLGVAAIAAGAVGLVLDSKMKAKIEANNELKSTYRNLTSGDAEYADYIARLDANTQKAKSYQSLRNTCYILAGVGLAGFAITFAF